MYLNALVATAATSADATGFGVVPASCQTFALVKVVACATVMPAADAALAAATEALARGEASRQPVLEATRRRLDAQLREAELEAELSRALAQLARSTGGHDAGG